MQSLQNFLAKPKHLSVVVGLSILVGAGIAVFNSNQDSPTKNGKRKRRPLEDGQQPPGLRNYGNTCFINCVLQALAGLPFFVNFLHRLCELSLNESRIGNRVTEHLYHLLLNLNSSEHETLNPSNLIDALRDKVDFGFYQDQQDCHELLKLLMDVIDSTLKEKTHDLNRSINPKSIPDGQDLVNPFNGYIAQVLICDQCGQESNIKLECFNDLSLIIKERDIFDLASVFDHFVKQEAVEDVECIRCSIAALIKKKKQAAEALDRQILLSEKKFKYILDLQEQIEYLKRVQKKSLVEHKELGLVLEKIYKRQIEKYDNDPEAGAILRHPFLSVKSHMKKCLRFARLPKILCIHLQRLTYDKYGDVVKINKHISFENELNLQPWLDKKLFSDGTSKAKYQLAAVIRHYGNESFGHYVTYRRICKPLQEPEDTTKILGPGEGGWSYTSDENTYPVKELEVLRSPAYMLFYERVETEADKSTLVKGDENGMTASFMSDKMTLSGLIQSTV